MPKYCIDMKTRASVMTNRKKV
eukprot:COSAG06_NODE_39072_length_416_cov_2.097792_2_plen_21_part_01